MSRTYRLRNLPPLNSRKYVDGHGGWGYRQYHRYLEELGKNARPEFYSDDYRSYFSLRWELERQLERLNPPPVGPTTRHPWVSWSRIARIKAWYKARGNRSGRRRARIMLRVAPLDIDYDESDRFPSRKSDFWDIWSLY